MIPYIYYDTVFGFGISDWAERAGDMEPGMNFDGLVAVLAVYDFLLSHMTDSLAFWVRSLTPVFLGSKKEKNKHPYNTYLLVV
jgi:hypothetical protein